MEIKVKKIAVFLLLISSIIIGNNGNVYAASATTTYGTGKYTRSVKRISWWMSYDNGGGWYEYQINNAIKNWENPGWSNPLHFVESDSNAGTMMDVYTKDESFWGYDGNFYAETFFYNANGQDIYLPISENYVFTRIYINDTAMHNFSANKMRGVIAHEIGHTLGLQHNNNNVNSLMCVSDRRKVETVQKTDNDAVVKFYK